MEGSKKEEDPFEVMQERLRRLGHDTMLLQPWTKKEVDELSARLDAQWLANETRLEYAMRKRDERRQKKQNRRYVEEGACCLIVPDERRYDRRGKRII